MSRRPRGRMTIGMGGLGGVGLPAAVTLTEIGERSIDADTSVANVAAIRRRTFSNNRAAVVARVPAADHREFTSGAQAIPRPQPPATRGKPKTVPMEVAK
jgi:UDP-N-acetyl-D-mannosaminuronate dehydrogenase